MAPVAPLHEFDESRAERYRSDSTFTKVVIPFEPAEREATTVLRTPFGEQSFRGRFYLIAQGAESYGAAPAEFEAQHAAVGPNEWVKHESVLAYRSGEQCVVRTMIDDHLESSVVAGPDDWIVKQSTGEVMVVSSSEFENRYAIS